MLALVLWKQSWCAGRILQPGHHLLGVSSCIHLLVHLHHAQTTLVELLQALRVDTRLALAVACRWVLLLQCKQPNLWGLLVSVADMLAACRTRLMPQYMHLQLCLQGTCMPLKWSE